MLQYRNTNKAEAAAEAVEPRLKVNVHVDGWYSGPRTDNSLVLFSESRADGTSACFVSMEVIDGEADKQKDLKKVEPAGDITPIGTAKLSLDTPHGKKNYQLDNYLVNPSASTTMRGLALGYIQLEGEYVKVDGHCEDEKQLSMLNSVFEAYRLN